MKRFAGIFLLLAGALFGAARWLDLAFFTDLTTGLCSAGSVWLRYGALAVLAVLGTLGALPVRQKPAALTRRDAPLGLLALGCAAVFAALAALQFLVWPRSASLVQMVLELLCAVWLVLVGCSWLAPEWAAPAGGALAAVGGSALFYWLVLVRFMQNSSSYHRVMPVSAVLTALSALLFLSALARALLLPQAANGRAVCRGGLWAFYYCLCMELPQALLLRQAGQSTAAQLAFSLGLCCVGALGGLCALRFMQDAQQAKGNG